MVLEQYIRTIVPTGRISVFGRGNKQFESEVDAAIQAHHWNSNGHDVYVKFASFAPGSGKNSHKADKVAYIQSTSLDIDIGPGKNYETIDEALDAFADVATKLKLPPPTIILLSGHGIRIVWVFTTKVIPAVWKPMANQFAGVCIQAGLNIDKGATTNITVGIRLPGQYNYKDPSNPVLTSLLHHGAAVDFEAFKQLLNMHPGSVITPNIKTTNDPTVNELTRANYDPYTFEEAAKHCLVLQDARDLRGAGASEERWKNVLQFLASATDGTNWVHAVSDGHPGYSVQGTEYKWEQRFELDGVTPVAPPPKCASFQTDGGTQRCGACPHNGKINSPWSLGKAPKPKPKSAAAPSQTATTLPTSPVSSAADACIPSHFAVHGDGTFLCTADNKGTPKYERICDAQFVDGHIACMQLEHDKPVEVLIANVVTAGGSKVLQMPLHHVDDSKKRRQTLAVCGIADTTNSTKLRDFLMSWHQELQRNKKYRRVVETLGWVDGGKEDNYGFYLPEKLYWKDRVDTSTITSVDPMLSCYYQSRGELNEWKQGAQALINGMSPEASLGVAVAFAAPLVSLTTVEGSLLSLYSAASGTGKTTAIQVGASVWGHPKHVLHMTDDTGNSALKKLESAPNLPVLWDEIVISTQARNANEIVNRIFRLAQGKGKARLNATSTLMQAGAWSTMACVTANQSLMDAVRTVKQNTDADLLRMIEVEVPALPSSHSIADALNRIRANYGLAGHVYAEFLVKHRDTLQTLISQQQAAAENEHFKEVAGARFWAATWACLNTGMRIAGSLGLVQFQVDRALDVLLANSKQQREEHKEAVIDDDVVKLLTYINASKRHYVSFRYQNPGDQTSQPLVAHDTYHGESADIINYLDLGVIEIKTAPFRKWLSDRGSAATTVVKSLRGELGCTKSNTNSLFGNRSPHPQGRVQYLRIDVKAGNFQLAGFGELK